MVKSLVVGDIVQTSSGLASSANKSALKAGKKLVAVVSTAVQLDANFAVPEGYAVLIKALAGNTNKVHIAGTKANAENDNNAYEMSANDFTTLRVTNLNQIWVDANVANEGVTFIVESD